jgi:hypothetical protein
MARGPVAIGPRRGQLPAAAAGAELVLAAGFALGVLDPASDFVVPDDEVLEPPSEEVVELPAPEVEPDVFPDRESVR